MVFCFLLFFHFLFFFFSSSGVCFILEFDFFSFFSIPFSFLFMMDWMSFSFSSFVILISSIIILYSNYYMMGDFYYYRFIMILILFVLSMVFLVFGGNFFMLMIGWDGLGLVSFCLVIYYSDKDALVSGMLTIMMNRLGDGLILMSIFYLNLIGGFNLNLFFYSGVGSFLLLFSFLTKSAQFPFSSWLPAAMSAPTPISSLVHSSTLVTAGIYLSIRFNYIFLKKEFSLFLMIVSLLTLFLGGALANCEVDFKKIVAMSTLSQLGLLFFMISIGFIKLSFFHMISHAFFKSLLFMGTGGVIINGSQDSRMKGGHLNSTPIIFSVMIVSLFSLMAVPFSVGFYSKDLALDFIFCGNFELIFYFLFVVGSLMTVLYSFRIMFLVFSFSRLMILETWILSLSFFFSLFMGIMITLFWGKFIFYMILMEDFILMSFPMKMIGGSLLVIGSVLGLSKHFLFYFNSFMIWFKYMILKLYIFDYFFKFDQVWVENFFYYNMNNFLLALKTENYYENKMILFSFFLVWFFVFCFFSLIT